ncbi:aldo/keto reductase [Mesorhizobium sp. M2E.F.Ca.ET.209.01.1.1]|uniref:aldo/keto reductase n=2 Tax=unclassified Mesorhizobium TaxID=325217 RepID=UPI000FDC04CF|nr:aldo/keto reductase [Mesorhizobium sp. M2E.F.Ca.ET.209.01.1.1]TGS17892.1 aldo/keto reductase [Mesorhizobium sp. M2E.F.Ca.ET.209.01.1.1]
MQQRQLGSSPVKVSEIGLGTWGMSGAFWGAADDEESIRVIRRALELGITLIDTAEAYGHGHAEEVVGKALAGRRDKAVIATKVAPNHLEPAAIEAALDGSLKRMQTDHVDVYFVHWPNSDFPIGPTMEMMERLRSSGRIKAVGVSNFSIADMESARQHGVIDVLQPPYNMLWREVEAETLPYCRKHNIGVMPYSGLAQGLLTGTLSQDTKFVEGDERRTTVLFQPGTYERAVNAVDMLKPIAARYGKTVPQLAIQWLTSRPGVSSPLVGARTVKELEENVESAGWTISDADIAAIDRITAPVWAEIKDKGDMFGFRARQRQEQQAKRA